MQKLDIARQFISESLQQSKVPAIACTFGKDSLLVTALVLQQAPEATCIWLHQFQTREQLAFPEQVMVNWNLTVWSCGAQEWSLIEHEGQWYAAMTYALNGDTFTTIHDLVQEASAPCVLKMRPRVSPPVTLPVDTMFTGWRKDDAHPLMPADHHPERIGNIRIVNPLADWTEADVWEATALLGLPKNHEKYNGNALADPDNLVADLRCLTDGVCTCPLI